MRILFIIGILLLISSASASQVIIARGQPAWVHEPKPGGSCWYFPDQGDGIFYDVPSTESVDGTYCLLDGSQTGKLHPMKYTLLYEEPALSNGKYFKDVSWINNTLVSAFSESGSFDEHGKDAPMILIDLEGLITSDGFNNFVTDEVVIQDPDLKLTELYQTQSDVYTAAGTSNLANGTEIIVRVDPERFSALHDDSFVYHTVVIRKSDEMMGNWIANMLMPIQTMPAGWHNLTVYVGNLQVNGQFKIDEQTWGPVPTPTLYIKYLDNGQIAPVTEIVTQYVPQYIDQWHTATPTPDITDALGQKIDYPYSPGGAVPEYVGITGFFVIAGIVLLRGWKWKR